MTQFEFTSCNRPIFVMFHHISPCISRASKLRVQEPIFRANLQDLGESGDLKIDRLLIKGIASFAKQDPEVLNTAFWDHHGVLPAAIFNGRFSAAWTPNTFNGIGVSEENDLLRPGD